MPKNPHLQVVTCLVVIALLPLAPALGRGRELADAFDGLIRGAARVGDEVPIRASEDVARELATRRAGRELLDAELKEAGKVTSTLGDAAMASLRAEEGLRLLRRAAPHLDPGLLRRMEQLDQASRESALVLAKGGERLAQGIPDLAARAHILREGGAETVAAIGIHGPGAAREVVRLDEALKAGGVAIKDAQRSITVADFGRVMALQPNAFAFWNAYVKPHWKLWAGSGALAAYLTNPEYFQDAAGRLTEAGFRQLTALAGAAAAGVIRGVGEGSGDATRSVWATVSNVYLRGWSSVPAAVGTLLLIAGLLSLSRRGRGLLRRRSRLPLPTRRPLKLGDGDAHDGRIGRTDHGT
jgi:hypothetical protein